jgi:hypothetical protein
MEATLLSAYLWGNDNPQLGADQSSQCGQKPHQGRTNLNSAR